MKYLVILAAVMWAAFLCTNAREDNGEEQEMEEIKEQIRQVFKNIQAVCDASGVSLDDIVKLNVYLSDLSVFAKVNDVMKELFSEQYPARAAIQVAKLPLDSLIEVEGIIVKK